MDATITLVFSLLPYRSRTIPQVCEKCCPSCQKLILQNSATMKQESYFMIQYMYAFQNLNCVKVLHASCTRLELTDLKVEHVTLLVFERCVVTYIVVPTHIVAGDNLCRYSRHILSPESIYCRQDEIFTLHILSLATIRANMCCKYCLPTL